MSLQEWRRLRAAARDPALAFLALIPLALLHLSGRSYGQNGAYSLVELGLRHLEPWTNWILGVVLAGLLLWAIGRVRTLHLPWRGGVALVLLEGAAWGAALGPLLIVLTELVVPGEPTPLAAGADWRAELRTVHAALAMAAGAGLYEELVFRAGFLAGLLILFQALFKAQSWGRAAHPLAFAAALLLSSLAFALAHKLGDPDALAPEVLAFRTLAGILLGSLYCWRGLAVTAYAHAAYDAYLLL